MRSSSVGVVLVLAMLDLTTGNAVYFIEDPWRADVDTITNNTCCYGNTDGFVPEVSGISPLTGVEYHSVANLRDELGVNCTTLLGDNNCRTCSIFASIQNNGFKLKCGLSKDHSDMGRTKLVMLVVSNSSDGQVSPTSPSNTYSNILKRIVTPSVLITAVLFGLFILAIAIILYKVYKNHNRQQPRDSQQMSQVESSLETSQTSESPLNDGREAKPFWKFSICDTEVESDAVQDLGATASILLRVSDSGLVQRRPHE